jgi:hypothetical protein
MIFFLEFGFKMSTTENYEKRCEAVTKHSAFLNGIIEGKPKGIRIRRWFYNYVVKWNRIFDTEEEEYKFVCKYCRGHWSMIYGVLTEPERDMLGKFAEDYGAFDY